MEDQQMLTAMFEEATIGILVVDRSGVIVKVNVYLGKLFGYSTKELLGQSMEILLPNGLRKKHIGHRQQYNEQPVPRAMGTEFNLFGQRKDSSQFPVEISLSYIKLEGELFAIAYVNDDTIQKKMLRDLQAQEKKITEYSEQLEQKVIARTKELEASEARLQSALTKERELGELKSRFVSMASHEFRTPLSSILSSANLIGRYERTEQHDKRMKHVNRIASSVQNLTSILNDFLSLEKLESGMIRCQPIQLRLPYFMEHLIEEMQLVATDGQTMIHHHKGPKEVVVDEYLLKNILINIISNALKYSPPHSVVHIDSYAQPHQLLLEIKDQGIGIPAEEQQYLFSRFFRANNAKNIKGTGLGLTIVKRYLDLMDGKIRFESVAGKGTSFFVEIPLG